MIRAVLFDLDDTLFDHRRSARAALEEVHRRHAATLDFAAFEHHHGLYLEEMHVEVLAGRIGLDDARRERFRKVFLALGVTLAADAVDAVASAYRSGYMVNRRALPGAASLLTALRPHARIVIVTNNLLDEQKDKLAYCGLAPLVDALVASGDVGVSKPDPAIFRIALARAGVPASEAVMVGDSWASDVAGARRAGIRAVWFNPERAPKPAEPPGIPDIHALEPADDVLALLLEREGPWRTDADPPSKIGVGEVSPELAPHHGRAGGAKPPGKAGTEDGSERGQGASHASGAGYGAPASERAGGSGGAKPPGKK